MINQHSLNPNKTMTEYCFQSTETPNKNKVSDFTIICSFILSHPLYFSYLIFFSPYLFKLLSFLSPLFFTTFLLFLSLLTTIIPLHSILNSNDGFFLTTYNTLLENLRPNFDNDDNENSQPLEEFEVYKVVFDIPIIEVSEANPIEDDKFEDSPAEFSEEKVCQDEEGTVKQCETSAKEHEACDTNPNKVEDEVVKNHVPILKSSGSEANEVKKTPQYGSLRVHDDDFGGQYLGSFGSMKKEKEWRRTLACKLFEERHNWSNNKINVNGGDGEECMDLLWETHDTGENKEKLEVQESKKGRRRDKIGELIVNDHDEDDYEEDYDDNGKICCLQALKLSAGKMNLSMGRPSLVKFSKAFKGIGWLQSHVRRQGKKGYK